MNKPRKEKKEVMECLKHGESATSIARKFSIPLSTVTTWKKEYKILNLREDVDNKKILIQEKMRCLNSVINNCEIKITNLVSKFLASDMSEKKWIQTSQSINLSLKDLARAILN